MKRALERLVTVGVLAGAVGLLAVLVRACPGPLDAALSLRDRSDWWVAYIGGRR